MRREEGESKIAPSVTGKGDLGKLWSQVDSFKTRLAASGAEITLILNNFKELAVEQG